MLKKIHRIKNTLFLNARSMLIFLLPYHLFFTLVLYLLASTVLGLSLQVKGYSHLTLENLLPTLLHPVTFVLLLVFVCILAFLICLEAGVLVIGFEASLADRVLSFRQLVTCGMSRFIRRIRHQHLYYMLSLTAYHLVSCFFLLYRLGFHVNPYSTFIPIIVTRPVYYVPFILAAAVITVFAFLRVFSFFFWYVSGYRLKESRKAGRRLFTAHLPVILREFLLVNALVALVWAVLRFVSQLALVLLVHLFVPARLEVAMVLSLNMPLSLIVLWICAVLAIFLNYAVLVFIYCHYSGENPILSFHLYKPHISRLKKRLLFTAAAAAVSAVVITSAIGFYRGALAAESPLVPSRIYCHRGYSSEAPENTLPAVAKALEALADGVEIDVQLTADGVPVLSHDVNTKRMTGIPMDIGRSTYGELMTLDYGTGRFSEYSGTRIATLEEVLDFMQGEGFLIIDLKRNAAGEELADRVVELIEEYNMGYMCAIQSTDTRYLRRVDELNPDIPLGLILTAAVGGYYRIEKYDYLCVRSMFVNKTSVENAHRAGKAIYAWTVNSRAELERMKLAQVDAIITDYPSRAKEVVYSEGDVETVMSLLRLILN